MAKASKRAPEKTSGAPLKETAPIKHAQDDRLAAASIAIATSYIGVKEATGHNDGAQVKKFQDYVGRWVEGQPWCAAFASFCIGTASKQLGKKPIFKTSASSTQIYAQAKSAGTLLSAPVPYCIGLLRGSGGTPGKTHHHTFRVLSVDLKAGTVKGLDGNWQNSVCYTHHRLALCDFVAVC